MYGVAPDYNGWDETNALIGNKIDEDIIDDVNQQAKGARIPKVSIPSPFARFDLIQKALSSIARYGENAAMRDKILVSHALDAIQLFYENPLDIEIITWQKSAAIEALKTSGYRSHNLLGDTLELYMRQENYGMNEHDHFSPNGTVPNDMSLFFLTYNKNVVAMTSPTSLFMATPRYYDFQQELTIDSGKELFKTLRPMLYDRDEEFIIYLYRTLRYFELKSKGKEDKILSPLNSLREFLASQKEILRSKNPSIYRSIANLEGLDEIELMDNYCQSDTAVYLMGIELFVRRQENIQTQISDVSDFIIKSDRSKAKPLILTNNLSAPNWIYTSRNVSWDLSKHSIDYKTVRFNKKYLPGTQTEYADGWLCEHDFFSDVIIQLPYKIDNNKYFDGNLKGADKISYLLPIKKKFFEFFPVEYLRAKDGKDDVFKIEVKDRKKNKPSDLDEKEVVVTLRIPVSNGKTVILKKTYIPNEDKTEGLLSFPDSSDEAKGYIVECPTEISIFPFVTMEDDKANRFVIQLSRDWKDLEPTLTPWRNNSASGELDKAVEFDGTPALRPSNSIYYAVNHKFDYLMLDISVSNHPAARLRDNIALIYPLMPEYRKENTNLRFAFDFGTSNSHIAVREDGGNEQFLDFKLGSSVGSTVPSDFKPQENMFLNLYNVYVKQEFIPREGIGDTYHFPTSTALLVPHSLVNTSNVRGLQDANIPFIYGMEDYDYEKNGIASNLKWSDDNQQANAKGYIEELVLLARAFAIEHNADLKKCTFTWTYPLSMSKREIDEFEEIWMRLYRTYFNPNESDAEENVERMSESIAPILYYRDNKVAIEEFNLSIDIGGGTCDVVLYQDKDNQRITSFRFGADNIFGVGTNKNNEMVRAAFEHFIKKITDLSKSSDTLVVRQLMDFNSHTVPASEANGRLFGLMSHRLLKRMDEEDKSYNKWLGKQRRFGLIFLYYYSAIIYYLAKLLLANGFDKKPAAIFFSGTGSKLLNIIGTNNHLRDLTSRLLEKFSNSKYEYKEEDIALTIEKKEPKQLTAKGALYVSEVAENIAKRIRRQGKKLMLRHPMSKTVEDEGDDEKGVMRYGHLSDEKVLKEIVESVHDFHILFCEIMESNAEDYRLDEEALAEFKRKYVTNSEAKDKLLAYMKTGIAHWVKSNDIESHSEREFEDVPFFYPIKEVIENLIRITN